MDQTLTQSVALMELIPAANGEPLAADRPPPSPGSPEELVATARVIGYPGAALLTCSDIEREIRGQLLWREE